MMKLTTNSHVVMSTTEFQTLKMSEVDDTIYNRIESKFRSFCGDKAKKLLEKYADKPFKEVANCTVIDLTDCFVLV